MHLAVKIFLGVLVFIMIAIMAWFIANSIITYKHQTNVDKVRLAAVDMEDFFETVVAPASSIEEDEENLPELVGLIIEPREHRNLIPVLRKFLKKLPELENIYVFHGIENQKMMEEEFGLEHPRIIMVPLGRDNITIPHYNYLMTHPDIYRFVRGKHILVFQTDSTLFENSHVDIKSYLKYDYVGAPWSKWNYRSINLENILMYRATLSERHGGNGGLSLRKRSTMIDITSHIPYLSIPFSPEDVYFAHAMVEVEDISLPTSEEAAKIFFEAIEADELPLGAHKFLPRKFQDLILDDEREIIESYKEKPLHPPNSL